MDLTLFLVSTLLGFKKLISDGLGELEWLEGELILDSSVSATDVIAPSFSNYLN